MKVFAIASAVFSVFASLVAAQEGVDWTVPVGEPKGNSIIKPGLNEKVPVGKPYPITWIPDTVGTVTLVLYKGPGNNIIPQYAIAKKIPNSGTYSWTPDTTFPDSKEGWGIRLIVDETGQNQWSTQFGFSNPDFNGGTTTTSGTATGTTTGSTSKATSSGTSSIVTSTKTGNSTTTKVTTTTKTTSTEVTTLGPDTTIVTTTIRNNGTTTTTGPAVVSSTGAAPSTGVHFGMGAIAFALAGFQLF